MRRFLSGALALSVLALGACQGGTPSLDTDDQKASYGIGHQMGGQLLPAEARIDLDAFLAGVRDGIAGNEPALDPAEIQVALQALSEAVSADEMEKQAAAAETNAAEGEAFLAENAQKDGVMVTASGLQYEVLGEGDGAMPLPEDQATMNYKGTLIDGTQFDSSYDRGEPATFSVGGVISGFSEGLQLMTVGSHFRFFIPGDLGYGPGGGAGGVIGPNALLIFEVELLEIPG
jgi:FKBP-type peptidyl-prolyl cis-trans isomerase